MKIVDSCYEEYIQPMIDEGGLDFSVDRDIVYGEIIKSILIDITTIHDGLSFGMELQDEPKSEGQLYEEARSTVIVVNRKLISLIKGIEENVVRSIDDMARHIDIIDTSYYDELSSLYQKLTQITKFTSKNTLQSIMTTVISGKRYNINVEELREKFFNIYLGLGRLMDIIENKKKIALERYILEILIYCSSLNIYFNIEEKDIRCR